MIKSLLSAVIAAGLVGGIAAPAFADWHDDHHDHEWREHDRDREWREREWREHHPYYAPPVVVSPAPSVVYAPPPVVYSQPVSPGLSIILPIHIR
ncbi:MAG TPA: hypothetical protein VKP60_19600 [Magnetospirillaceae bacterium]|nr:hypothetical protein [Magnetospirillaceae bacterium]